MEDRLQKNEEVSVRDFCCEKHDKWTDNKVRELIAVKILYTSLLNTTVVAFKVLPFGSYAPMLAPSPLFKKFWNWFCGIVYRDAIVLHL